MNNTKVIYTGQSNPYRKGSNDYHKFNEQKDWWMNNLNINIIRDYLQNLNYQISALETQNDMLWDFKNNVEDKQYQ